MHRPTAETLWQSSGRPEMKSEEDMAVSCIVQSSHHEAESLQPIVTPNGSPA